MTRGGSYYDSQQVKDPFALKGLTAHVLFAPWRKHMPELRILQSQEKTPEHGANEDNNEDILKDTHLRGFKRRERLWSSEL